MEHSTQRGIALLTTYLAGLRWRVLALAVLLFSATGVQLAAPQVLRTFIDDALSGAPLERLYAVAGVFIAASILAQVLAVGAAYLSEQVGWTATNLLRADLVRHALGLGMPFHQAYSPGRMIERIDGDVTALSNFFSQFVIRIVGGLLLLVGVLVLIAIEEPRVGLALGVAVGLSLYLIARGRSFAVPHVNAEREASADLYGFVEERLGGVEDIRANGAGDYTMRRSFDVGRALVFAGRRAELYSGGVWSLATGAFALCYVLVLALSGFLYTTGEITIGTVYLFFQYTQILRRPLEQLADQLREFQRAGAAIGRVHELNAIRPALEQGHREAVESGPASLAFDDVSFGYRQDTPVLRDVSFHLGPGRVLGVLGRTGSGKTTVSRLALRLYDPTAGVVRLDGIDVREYRWQALRERVGVVTQDVQVVAGSVRDNLTLFDPTVTDARIFEALDALGLGEWVRAMPGGLDSPLAAGAGGLSAGEAQLLAFARIFLRDPGLVILDEASSRLDPATEERIERAVDRLLTGRTAVLIAHRLHTLDRADEVLVLDDGAIAEYGTREALAADPSSRYASLLRASAGATEAEVLA